MEKIENWKKIEILDKIGNWDLIENWKSWQMVKEGE